MPRGSVLKLPFSETVHQRRRVPGPVDEMEDSALCKQVLEHADEQRVLVGRQNGKFDESRPSTDELVKPVTTQS